MLSDESDKRTVHLLPPASKDNKDWYGSMRAANALSIPNAYRAPANSNGSIITPTEEEVRHYSNTFIGPHARPSILAAVASSTSGKKLRKGKKSKNKVKNYNWKLNRYGAILVDAQGRRRFGKIIAEDLDKWAELNGFKIERSFKMTGMIDPEKERTEITNPDGGVD